MILADFFKKLSMADKPDLQRKFVDTSGLVKKLDYNTKITEIKNKIPSICSLAIQMLH